MNLHNDLLKSRINHSCKDCCRKCGKNCSACENFYPDNMTEFMGYALDRLREMVEPSREHMLKRHAVHDGKSFNDRVPAMDYYYVLLVNTALAEIRKGKTDYVYSFEQIRDIMRFEPDITAKYIADAEAYEIRKAR